MIHRISNNEQLTAKFDISTCVSKTNDVQFEVEPHAQSNLDDAVESDEDVEDTCEQ